jgi:hypothetical protein
MFGEEPALVAAIDKRVDPTMSLEHIMELNVYYCYY